MVDQLFLHNNDPRPILCGICFEIFQFGHNLTELWCPEVDPFLKKYLEIFLTLSEIITWLNLIIQRQLRCLMISEFEGKYNYDITICSGRSHCLLWEHQYLLPSGKLHYWCLKTWELNDKNSLERQTPQMVNGKSQILDNDKSLNPPPLKVSRSIRMMVKKKCCSLQCKETTFLLPPPTWEHWQPCL